VSNPTRGGSSRLGVIDVARGVAVAAMIVFHAAWDLSELRLMEADIRAIPAWSAFAHVIAGSFLILTGAGLVLAHGGGLRPRAFLRRSGRARTQALMPQPSWRAQARQSILPRKQGMDRRLDRSRPVIRRC